MALDVFPAHAFRDIQVFRPAKQSEIDQGELEFDPKMKTGGNNLFSMTYDPVNKSVQYIFSVRPDFRVPLLPESYNEIGVPSPNSTNISAECSRIPSPNVSVSSRQVTVRWKTHPNPLVTMVKLVYTLISIGDCSQLASEELKSFIKSTEVTRLVHHQELDYWRDYSVEVYGLTDDSIRTNSQFVNFSTGAGPPEGAPTNLRLIGKTSSSNVTITWDPTPCESRRGPFRRFKLVVSPNHTGLQLIPSNKTTWNPPLSILGLQPQTSYELSVAFENTVGSSLNASLTFVTRVTGAPYGVRVLNVTHDAVLLGWLAPRPQHGLGALTGYRIKHWLATDQSELIVHQETPLLSPDTTEFWLRRLMKLTDYVIQVSSFFGDLRQESGSVQVRTLETPAGLIFVNLHLINRSFSTILIEWDLSGAPVTSDFQLQVSISLDQSLLPTPPTFITRSWQVNSSQSGSITFEALEPASKYRIAINKASHVETNIIGVTTHVWTTSAPFNISDGLRLGDFKIISETQTTVTVSFPEIKSYNGGPLTSFYVSVLRTDDAVRLLSTGSKNDDSRRTNTLSASLTATNYVSPTQNIVHQSNTWPNQPIVIGSGNAMYDSSIKSLYTFANPPLATNTTYVINAHVESRVNGTVETGVVGALVVHMTDLTSGASSMQQTRTYETQLVGGIIGALLVLTTIGLIGWMIFYYCFRKESGKHGSYYIKQSGHPNVPKCAPDSGEDYMDILPKSYAWWSVPVDIREPRYLVVDPMHGPTSSLVGTWSKKDLSETFVREYASVPLGYKYACRAGNIRSNRSKNRTQSSLPYDHNRVVLKRRGDTTESDYINASFVDGYMRRRAYIAAQSPFDTPTACDFWLMVFQRNVAQIVMLTNLVEDGALRCCQYWPDVTPHNARNKQTATDASTKSIHYFDTLAVQAIDRIAYAHFTVLQFSVTEISSGATRAVVLYHFHSWGNSHGNQVNNSSGNRSRHNGSIKTQVDSNASCNFGQNVTVLNSSGHVCELFVPDHAVTRSVGRFDELTFIEFYYRVKTASRPENGPIVVHCATGFTRSSLFIALDTLLQQATHERVVSVARYCGQLCKARANIFHSTQQYVLLYDLLFEALLAGHSILDLDVMSTYRMLIQKNVRLNRSFLWEQWSVLHHYTPSPDPDWDLRAALSASNAKRNRYSKELDLLAMERWRPHLRDRLSGSEWTGYINAVFLDGTSLRDDLIITQTPMANTLDDFWTLVDDEQVSCIVDMEPFGYGVKGALRYWPLRAGESISEPLFDGSSDEDRDRVESPSDREYASATRGPWLPMASGKLQVCQLGTLTPVLSDSANSKKNGPGLGLYRRRLLIRRRESSTTNGSNNVPEKSSKRRELLMFHFAGDWNTATQVPESRITFVRLLEAIRLERGTGPLLIHCLDGATRSGLLAMCHLLTERITRDHYVDLFHVVKAAKRRRRAIIASQDQLRFIYRLLAQWIKQTLAEPLAAWGSQHLTNVTGKQSAVWPQLIGHLPPHVRTGIFYKSQLPALVADQPIWTSNSKTGSVEPPPMHNASNNTTDLVIENESDERAVAVLYYYFQEELLNQRSTYSLNYNKSGDGFGITGDLSDAASWSTGTLNRIYS